MVKIVVRKADGSEIEAEVSTAHPLTVIRLEGKLYQRDRVDLTAKPVTVHFIPAEVLEL